MSKFTKEQLKLRPKNWTEYILRIFSGVTWWIRVPYNLLNGVSFKECIRQEKLDLWNVGLKYRLPR